MKYKFHAIKVKFLQVKKKRKSAVFFYFCGFDIITSHLFTTFTADDPRECVLAAAIRT